jgi:ribonuclease VapC
MLMTKLSSKGQMVLPSKLRKKYNLRGGATVGVEDRDGKITIIPNPENTLAAFLALRGVMSHIEEDVEGIWMDANALIRFYRNLPGADTVQEIVGRADAGQASLSISAVNLTEVLYILSKYFRPDEARRMVELARSRMVTSPIDDEVAIRAGMLKARFRLGLADCFAAELAIRLGAILVTADPEFERVAKQLKILALPRHAG